MHAEWGRIDAATAARLNAARAAGGRLIAILDAPLALGDSAHAGFQRKEHELAHLETASGPGTDTSDGPGAPDGEA